MPYFLVVRRGRDNHADRQVDDISLKGKLFKFVQKRERAPGRIERTESLQRSHHNLHFLYHLA